jgi:formate/nitrite transporter FocA (FNT family)
LSNTALPLPVQIYGLPIGLLAVIVFGADLFTGNCMTSFAALVEGQIDLIQYLKVSQSS